MTTLLERIEADHTQARRDGKGLISIFLGYLLAESRRIGKDATPSRDSTDEEVIGVVRKLISRNEENIVLIKDPVRAELDNAKWQNELMNKYLPAQTSEDELIALINEFIAKQTDEKSLKMMGSVMSMLKETRPGQYNPQLASQIAKKLLAV